MNTAKIILFALRTKINKQNKFLTKKCQGLMIYNDYIAITTIRSLLEGFSSQD